MSRDLGGAFIWSVEMDDFRGTCGDGDYPLLTQINAGQRLTSGSRWSLPVRKAWLHGLGCDSQFEFPVQMSGGQ